MRSTTAIPKSNGNPTEDAAKDEARPTSSEPMEVGGHRKLDPAHLKEMAASGITPETAKAAGLYSESDRKRLARLIGWKGWKAEMGTGLVFPYLDDEGRELFSRVKPDNPPQQGGKPRKYLQPKGIATRCYFPPGVREDLLAGNVRVLITEGEKKAISASQHGFTTIGLSGVNAWCRPKCTSLNADLGAIDWKGRKVYIAFDSDVVVKQAVAFEEQKLAMALEREGAIVTVIRLPAGPPDSAGEPTKCGLDDFLVSHKPGELEKLIEQAEPAEKPDPGSIKGDAKNADPGEEAAKFLQACGLGDQPRIRFYHQCYWYWSGGSYYQLSAEEVRAQVCKHLSRDFLQVKPDHISSCLEHIRSQTIVEYLRDTPVWLEPASPDDPPANECVAFRNGTLHLPGFIEGSNELVEATPRFFTTSRVDFDFAPDPPRPARWLKFLDEVFGDDEQAIELLQEWFGYCLTPDTRQQKSLFILGPKRSGKGTIARVLNVLLGKRNVAAPTLNSLTNNFGLQPLIGKPLAVIHDARLSGKADKSVVTERLLSITGEDHQTIDIKHRQPITVKLPTRFMIMSNELPRFSDSSGALAGRMLFLSTPTSFYGREDKNLTADLMDDLPGIFKWATNGWARLRQRGRFVQPTSSEHLGCDLSDLSSPVGKFVRDQCELAAGHVTTKDDLRQAYEAWCVPEGVTPLESSVFGRDLSAAAPSVERVRRTRDGSRHHCYEGIGIKA